MELLVDDRQGRDRAEPDDGAELVRRVGEEVAVEAQDVGGVLGRPEQRPGRDDGADRVQREPERGDDAEVPASSSQGPEQVRVIAGGCLHDLALGGDHLRPYEVVHGEPVLAHEPAEAAAEADATDAGVSHDATRGGQTVGLCLVVDIPPEGSALDEGGALDRIDRDGTHRRQVDHDPAVAHRRAGDVVTPAANGDLEIAVAGEAHGNGHIGGAVAAGDQPRASVDGAVPDRSGVVVVGVVGDDHIAPETQESASWWCHRSSSVDALIATSRRSEVKSANWTSMQGIWTSRRSGGGDTATMRTYGQYCPIARGAEIFAERWTPLIIRNLHLGCETFGEILEGAPGLSRTCSRSGSTSSSASALSSRHQGAGRGHRTSSPARATICSRSASPLASGERAGSRSRHRTSIRSWSLWSMCNAIRRDRLPDQRVVIRVDSPAPSP